jgi:hypothetical protein
LSQEENVVYVRVTNAGTRDVTGIRLSVTVPIERTDTIVVLTAIALNLIALAVNSAVAVGRSATTTVVTLAFAALVIVVNFVAEIGLIKGRQTREKLLAGLIKMCKDNGVDQSYDPELLSAYRTGYDLFMLAVLFTGLVALFIPFVVR